MSIKTFVFFDLETTGLPREERNRVKITELCFLAVSRKDIIVAKCDQIPPHQKLSLLFNPEKDVHPVATRLTGLSRGYLQNCATFRNKVETILTFFKELEEPVALVAHNGNTFDFKILRSEFENAGKSLLENLLCVDSLIGFRKILKENPIDYTCLNSSVDDGILTDDEDDDFPDLNISNEDWNDIDNLSASLSGITFGDSKNAKCSKGYESYTLSSVYMRLLNKEASNAHRAEGDCVMLLECVVALKDHFLSWADSNCKKISTVKPFVPY